MGIPRKFASRQVTVIPFDFLPLDDEQVPRDRMFWGMGQLNLKAAALVKRHAQLFGVWVTNFSCGPDSFLLGHFRRIMGRKPSLTLELDSHTADAGIETRVEAFLDIADAHRRLTEGKILGSQRRSFRPMETRFSSGQLEVISSSNEVVPVADPRVTILVPSMGRLGTEGIVAGIRGTGVRAEVAPPADESVLKIGRIHTSCKECLPLILTAGTLLKRVQNGRRDGELLLYFMPTADGPCRFGQYAGFMKDLIQELELPNGGVMSMNSSTGYGELGLQATRMMWWGLFASDIMEDVRSLLLANARDPEQMTGEFEQRWQEILKGLESGKLGEIQWALGNAAQRLGRMPIKQPWADVPVISLVGEIFVRRDDISRQRITERLAEKGFAVHCSYITEWLHYCDWCVDAGHFGEKLPWMRKLKHNLKEMVMAFDERRMQKALAAGPIPHLEQPSTKQIARAASRHISPALPGEAILTVGAALHEVVTHSAGVIAIGPFGCMPNRLSESILTETMSKEEKLQLVPESEREAVERILEDSDPPFLAIESDGMAFPQIIEARLEAFLLQAARLHKRIRAAN